jgi:CAAX prenyl protease-like protein
MDKVQRVGLKSKVDTMPATKRQSPQGYYVPFAVFIILGMAGEALGLLFSNPQYLVKPAQTLICAGLLFYYWPSYEFGDPVGALRRKRLLIGLLAGVVAFLVWVAPQILFHAPPRLEGFDPTFFGDQGWPYWLNLALRLLRLVIIVPLVEEIFWRGFVMRWLVRQDFTAVAFGTFQAKTFVLVALLFMLEHASIDYAAAFVAGLLYNAVAVLTRSLGICVVAHAVTNLLLGLYILRSEQWGFW